MNHALWGIGRTSPLLGSVQHNQYQRDGVLLNWDIQVLSECCAKFAYSTFVKRCSSHVTR
jgi:hypothetical protein